MKSTERSISVGIDPAGIGTTGICIKTFNGCYPQKWTKSIKAENPVEAGHKIINFVEEKLEELEYKNFSLKEVIVELPHGGNEKLKEVKATRELVGILRFHFGSKFKGHLPNHKSFKVTSNNNSHENDAESIMYAHFLEQDKKYQCENAWGIIKKWQ